MEVYYVLILKLLTLLLFCRILLQPQITPLICLFSAECPMQMSWIILSSLCILWIVLKADAGCFLHLSSYYGFWIWEARGSLSVLVKFLQPKAETMWTTPSMAVSVSNPWSLNYVRWFEQCWQELFFLKNPNIHLEDFLVCCGLTLICVIHQNHFTTKKLYLNLSKLLTAAT